MARTEKPTPSQLYHAGLINKYQYEEMLARGTGSKKSGKTKDKQRILGKKV
jgi:hypothetical protein